MYTIKDLKNGKCAVINDGTKEELIEVLQLAGCDKDYEGLSKYYFVRNGDWGDSDIMYNIPTRYILSVKDFLLPEQGEEVLVRDHSRNKWQKREFIFFNKNSEYPYVTSVSKDSYIGYKKMKRIPKEDNLEINITLNGKSIKPSEISQKTWDNLRNK